VLTSSVLIIGASGNFGAPLVEEFIGHLSKFEKVGILSAPEKTSLARFAAAEERGVQVVSGSFLSPASYEGYDTVISLAGNAIMKLQPGMIEAAIAANPAMHFYASEYGSDVSQEELKYLRYFRDKRVTQDHLVAAAKAHSQFRYTLLLTGPFMEWTIDEYYGVFHERKEVITYGRPDAPIDVTSIPE
jgi:uncharacterized protein YbjT (DUF2867 family)